MMVETVRINTDVLVVGGGAGALAAIRGMDEGAKVLVATKGPFVKGREKMYQEGGAKVSR